MNTNHKISNGIQIKAMINGNTKDRFDWVDDPKQKQALNCLVACIEKYREIEFIQRYSNAGFESTDQRVFELMRQRKWEDSVIEYKMECQKLLTMFATPAIHQAMKDEGFYLNDTIKFIDHLFDFFRAMDNHPYHTLFLKQEVLDFGTDFTDKQIQDLTEEYEMRIAVAASGKVRNMY